MVISSEHTKQAKHPLPPVYCCPSCSVTGASQAPGVDPWFITSFTPIPIQMCFGLYSLSLSHTYTHTQTCRFIIRVHRSFPLSAHYPFFCLTHAHTHRAENWITGAPLFLPSCSSDNGIDNLPTYTHRPQREVLVIWVALKKRLRLMTLRMHT